MAFFTDQQVRLAAASVPGMGRVADEASARAVLNLLERYTPAEDESSSSVKTFDIFLSHSSLDAVQVLGIYWILFQRGYSVYLDRVCDPHLNRATVNKATATTIRRRMTQCRSLFVATSANTTASQWVPWELGFTDGLTGKAAILPIVPEDTVTFGGLSYFELYPNVQDASPASKPNDLTIWDGNSLIGTWGSWLSLPRMY